MVKTLIDASEYEVNVEKERYKCMCFLIWSYEIRYGELLEVLKKVLYKGRYEYPETVKGAYEYLIRTPRHIFMSTSQGDRFSSRTRGGGRLNFSFSQNYKRENIGKQKERGNAEAHGYAVPGKMG